MDSKMNVKNKSGVGSNYSLTPLFIGSFIDALAGIITSTATISLMVLQALWWVLVTFLLLRETWILITIIFSPIVSLFKRK